MLGSPRRNLRLLGKLTEALGWVADRRQAQKVAIELEFCFFRYLCPNHSFYLPEQAVKEILDTWESMKFTVIKYFKGTQERGYILGSVDEIIQCLDDNTVNLQSISGSRFVGPFLQTVHKWEKTLSLIGEVIEVREKPESTFIREYFVLRP